MAKLTSIGQLISAKHEHVALNLLQTYFANPEEWSMAGPRPIAGLTREDVCPRGRCQAGA